MQTTWTRELKYSRLVTFTIFGAVTREVHVGADEARVLYTAWTFLCVNNTVKYIIVNAENNFK
jgi:hypothetical protein